jgi:hypothetical protein
MPRNTGGVRSKPSFRPGGSKYTNTSFNEDLECRDLHAFGSIVCNGEQRVQGNIMSGGMHVDDSGLLKVPVVNAAPNVTTPADHPNQAGLVMVNKSSDGKMYFSRENGTYNAALQDAVDKHAGAVAAHDAIDSVTAADSSDVAANNTADVAAALAAIDALAAGNTKFEEGVLAVKTAVATDLATSKSNADTVVSTLAAAKTPSAIRTSTSGHGPFEWVAVN